MKNVICTIILWGLTQLSFAEISCVSPSLSATIYFSNGIQTDVRSAKASRAVLEAVLGKEYNVHALDYAIAYNEKSGMAADLAQATAQSGVQNNKNVLRWLNGKNLAPEWFLNWFDQYLSNRNLDVAKKPRATLIFI